MTPMYSYNIEGKLTSTGIELTLSEVDIVLADFELCNEEGHDFIVELRALRASFKRLPQKIRPAVPPTRQKRIREFAD